MESIFILIPISIVLVFVIGAFFWWSSKNGQFDDLEGPAFRILMDDDDIHHDNEQPVKNKIDEAVDTEQKPPQ